ncbi:MAG: hypothetical protein LBF41_09395 [Deltaproteobacteria bacterium]|jgi:hypothetical protein|nr:hypothetical protein [Deltaproteobacteria bacterium]
MRKSIPTAATLALFATLAALFLSACVLTMPDPLLKQRNLAQGVIPDLTGKWKEDKGNTVTITRGPSNNTFRANNVSNENELLVTFERLDESHYMMQVAPQESKGVFLTIAELTPTRINIYTYPKSLDAIRKIAAKNGVTVTEAGLITGYEKSDGMVELFRALSLMREAEYLVLTKQ